MLSNAKMFVEYKKHAACSTNKVKICIICPVYKMSYIPSSDWIYSCLYSIYIPVLVQFTVPPKVIKKQ